MLMFSFPASFLRGSGIIAPESKIDAKNLIYLVLYCDSKRYLTNLTVQVQPQLTSN